MKIQITKYTKGYYEHSGWEVDGLVDVCGDKNNMVVLEADTDKIAVNKTELMAVLQALTQVEENKT